MSCHANCLILRGVNVLSLAVRNFQGRRVFLLEVVHYVPLIVWTKLKFSLVHTNIVGVMYDSKGLATNLCVEQERLTVYLMLHINYLQYSFCANRG